MKRGERPDCYEKAVDLLARRPHFAAELGRKLASRGYERDEVEAALTRLVAEGYLNDRQTTEGFVALRQSRSPEGSRRLAAELARRGAPSAAVLEVLSEIDPEQELEAARLAAERWRRKGSSDRAALARHLDRKGFSQNVIYRLLGEFPDE